MPDIGVLDIPAAITVQTSATPRRALFLALVAIATLAGFLATDADATAQSVAQAGTDLARLLRAMAAMKALAAIALVAVTCWRLAAPISPARWTAYALSCAAMAAGPGLIWGMTHLVAGAALLHGGLVMSALVLWRDPAMAHRLAAEITRRRSKRRAAT